VAAGSKEYSRRPCGDLGGGDGVEVVCGGGEKRVKATT